MSSGVVVTRDEEVGQGKSVITVKAVEAKAHALLLFCRAVAPDHLALQPEGIGLAGKGYLHFTLRSHDVNVRAVEVQTTLTDVGNKGVDRQIRRAVHSG